MLKHVAPRLITTLLAAAATVPVAAQPQWYKGNLHTHTLWSDGNDFPEMVADWYKARGYHFLALSDHDILSEGEGWMTLETIERRSGTDALAKYRARFGTDHVETRDGHEGVEIRLRTLEEVRALHQEPGAFILIQAEEITDSFEGHPVHINATNLQELIARQGGQTLRDTIRRNLVAIEEQSERLGVPMLGHVNHPNYGWALTAEDLAHVLEDRFFEVFNGHPSVNSFGDRTRPSTARMWDIANAIRVGELDAPPLYGLGTDDSHNYHSGAGSIPGRGWVMVRAESLDAAAIVTALHAGDFYASTGVTLKDVRIDAARRTLTLDIDPADNANYLTRFIGTRRGIEGDAAIGEVLAESTDLSPSYTLVGDEMYVRAMVISSREVEFPLVDGQKRQAWTQPVGWRPNQKTEITRQK